MNNEIKIQNIFKVFEEKYIQKNCTLYNLSDLSSQSLKDLFKTILMSIINESPINETKKLVKNLSDIYVQQNITYDILHNEFNFLQKSLLYIILEDKNNQKAMNLLKLFDEIDVLVNRTFLENYLKELLENNSLRLKTISSSVQDKMISFYEAHIKWVNQLTLSILNRNNTELPEMDHHACKFGKWLDSDDISDIITNMDDYLQLYEIHKTLHNIAQEVSALLSSNENHNHVLLTYAHKAENISKEIGLKLSTVSNEIMMQNATKDKLTGVLNRELLEQLFTKELELHASTNKSILFVVCDLDHFKIVNDTYGHVAGDKVLQSFANLLQKTLRATDIIIRYGGEEFILILPTANLLQGLQILNNLRKKFKKQVLIYDEHEISVTVSMGLIELKPQLKDNHNASVELENCIKKADELLYKAKNNGRDRIEV